MEDFLQSSPLLYHMHNLTLSGACRYFDSFVSSIGLIYSISEYISSFDDIRYVLRPKRSVMESLTFKCPCIANIFSEYNQQDATFLKFIYFCKTLYMFQAGFPSIIRSIKLHIQLQAFVDRYCYLPLACKLSADSSNGLQMPDAVCAVLCS